MAVTSDFGISATVRNTKASDLSAAADDLIKRYGVHLESGSGAGKADRIFADTRTLAASATETLDLAGPSPTRTGRRPASPGSSSS
ncbi:hypothetical protein [Streptomyces sp. NPDC059949]|uniref:hypothetical protein n=1 Tax=Streptomyces sp. NPDC059949 TaxID=3347013 RepID=UPI00365CB1D3